MNILLQVIIAGIVTGCIYALVALSFTLILKVIDMVNFAQGDLLMVGAFVFYGLATLIPWPSYITLPVTLILSFLFGMGFAWLVVFPMRKAGGMSLLIIAIGFGIILQDVTRIIFGAQAIGVESVIGSGIFNVGELVVRRNDAGILLVAVVCVVGLIMFLQTKLGTAVRATAADVDMSGVTGINVRFIICLVFGLSMVLSAIAGIFLAPRTQLINTMGAPLLLKAFTGAVIGGFGSIPGAIIGGIIVGVLENLIALYVSTAYASAITFAVLIVVLIARPTGLMGKNVA